MSDSNRSNGPRLRYALIGGGAGIAATHIAALRQIPEIEIVALADVDVTKGTTRAEELGVPFYQDHRALLAEQKPDVAVITTPHPFHADLTIDSFEAGAHVLVEKPIAVEVAEADRMVAASERTGKLLGVNFQNRFRPTVIKAKELITNGAVGPLVRVLVIEPWYRPAAYYRSAGWRGTWKGEGGGVLLNQAIHTIDLMGYLAGQPKRIWGWARTLQHAIECEDTAQALLEFENGAPGYFATSTTEPATERRIEIIGNNGGIELRGETLSVLRYIPSISQHMREAKGMFESPAFELSSEALPGDGGGHLTLHRDFLEAVQTGRAPICDGREATKSLELANALTLSSAQERPLDLPIDRAAYSALLAKLRGE